MQYRYLSTLFCTLLLAASPLSFAQQADPDAADGSTDVPMRLNKVGVRFVCTKLNPQAANVYMQTGEKKAEKLIMQTRHAGLRQAMPKEGRVVLLDGDFENPTLQPKVLCSGQVPAGCSQALAMLSPSPTGYSMQLLDEREYKPGAVHLLNPTPLNLRLKIDNKPYVIKPKGVLHFSPESGVAKSFPVQIWFENPAAKAAGNDKEQDNWKLYSAGTWRIHPDSTQIGIFGWNSTSKRPELNSVTLYKEPEMPQQGAQ